MLPHPKRSSESTVSTAVGDEGGFAPDLESNEAAIELLVDAITAAGFGLGDDIAIALNPPAPNFS